MAALPDRRVAGRVDRSEEPSTYRFTAWNTLYQQLLGGIGGRYRLGHALCGLDMADDGVELRFANGLVEHAELVVGTAPTASTRRCGAGSFPR